MKEYSRNSKFMKSTSGCESLQLEFKGKHQFKIMKESQFIERNTVIEIISNTKWYKRPKTASELMKKASGEENLKRKSISLSNIEDFFLNRRIPLIKPLLSEREIHKLQLLQQKCKKKPVSKSPVKSDPQIIDLDLMDLKTFSGMDKLIEEENSKNKTTPKTLPLVDTTNIERDDTISRYKEQSKYSKTTFSANKNKKPNKDKNDTTIESKPSSRKLKKKEKLDTSIRENTKSSKSKQSVTSKTKLASNSELKTKTKLASNSELKTKNSEGKPKQNMKPLTSKNIDGKLSKEDSKRKDSSKTNSKSSSRKVSKQKLESVQPLKDIASKKSSEHSKDRNSRGKKSEKSDKSDPNQYGKKRLSSVKSVGRKKSVRDDLKDQLLCKRGTAKLGLHVLHFVTIFRNFREADNFQTLDPYNQYILDQCKGKIKPQLEDSHKVTGKENLNVAVVNPKSDVISEKKTRPGTISEKFSSKNIKEKPSKIIGDAKSHKSSVGKSVKFPNMFEHIIHYVLSNPLFMKLGWTLPPSDQAQLQVVTFKAVPSTPNTYCFRERSEDEVKYYSKTLEKIAYHFRTDGTGEIFYPSGSTAAKMTKHSTGMRLTLYSDPGNDPLIRGSLSNQILGIFDSFGNGVVYDTQGIKLLNFNQLEGIFYSPHRKTPYKWQWCDYKILDKYRIKALLRYMAKEQKQVIPAKKVAMSVSVKKSKTAEPRVDEVYEQILAELPYPVPQKTRKKGDNQFWGFKPVTLKVNNEMSLRINGQDDVSLSFSTNKIFLRVDLGVKVDPEVVDRIEELASKSPSAVPCVFDALLDLTPSLQRLNRNTLKGSLRT